MAYIPLNNLPQLPVALDAFNRLRVSPPTAIFSSKMIFDAAPSTWSDAQLSGAGTSSTYNTNQASVTLAVSASTAGSRARQTFRRFNYQPGKGQLISLTGVLGTPAAGITRRLGMFDGANGVFFESSPTSVNVVVRSSTSGASVDTVVPQALWNVDKMDGTGPSGITLDFAKSQIFSVDFQWLGEGFVRFGFFVGLSFYVCHVEQHANLVTTVYMSDPNLPLRYEISNSGAGGAASLVHICTAVISEGGQEFNGQYHAVTRGATGLATLNNSDLYPILAIRLASGRAGAIVRPDQISMLSTTNANIEMQLLRNPTVTGAALSFSAVTNSSVEAAVAATSATTVSGGTLLTAAVGAASSSILVQDPADFELGVSLTGVSDVLVVAGRRLSGASETIFASLTWKETP